MRFFGGYTVEEVAEFLAVSEETVALEWRMARAWLQRELDVKPARETTAGEL
jgi:DNA-directed RNA polymerase specialized sigma24 family protein